MAAALEGQLLGIDDLARAQGRRGEGAVHVGGGNVGAPAARGTIPGRERREVLLAVVPHHLHRRHVAARAELEAEGGLLREEEVVRARELQRVDLIRQAQFQELVARVDQVRRPVADGAHAEVEPAAPVAGMVLPVVVVPLGRGEPGVPVHARREGLLLRELLDIHVIGMPAAPVVVVRDDLVDVLDDAGVLPGLELEVVRLGVALVAHLRGELGVLPRGGHQQLALVEGARHGLFHIHVLAAVEGEHRDGEMREVRDGDAHGVEMVRVLVEELAEVLEQLRLGELGDGLAAFGALRVHVAQGDDVAEAGPGEIVDDLGAAVRDADGREAHLGPLGGRRGGAVEALGGKVLHAEDGAGRAEAGRLQEVASGKRFHGVSVLCVAQK